MIDVVINGEAAQLPEGSTIASMVSAMLPSSRGVAVAIDREVQPRSAWSQRTICEGDLIEVVTAAAGG